MNIEQNKDKAPSPKQGYSESKETKIVLTCIVNAVFPTPPSPRTINLYMGLESRRTWFILKRQEKKEKRGQDGQIEIQLFQRA